MVISIFTSIHSSFVAAAVVVCGAVRAHSNSPAIPHRAEAIICCVRGGALLSGGDFASHSCTCSYVAVSTASVGFGLFDMRVQSTFVKSALGDVSPKNMCSTHRSLRVSAFEAEHSHSFRDEDGRFGGWDVAKPTTMNPVTLACCCDACAMRDFCACGPLLEFVCVL